MCELNPGPGRVNLPYDNPKSGRRGHREMARNRRECTAGKEPTNARLPRKSPTSSYVKGLQEVAKAIRPMNNQKSRVGYRLRGNYAEKSLKRQLLAILANLTRRRQYP
jgi:hypothetical protein